MQHLAGTVGFAAPCRYCRFCCTLQVLSVLLHLAGTVSFAAPCRYCQFCCTLQVLSVLLHLVGTVGFAAPCRYCWFSMFGIRASAIPYFRPSRLLTSNRDENAWRAWSASSIFALLHVSLSAQSGSPSGIWGVFILLTINAVAVARCFIWSPKLPDPRDILFNWYRRFSPGVQQSGLAVNHWAQLCAKN